MSDTSLSLQESLPERTNSIIKLVVEAAEKLSIPAFIVGATARDIIFSHVFKVKIYRETSDIDFGVAVESWEQFEQIKAELISPEKFRIDQKISHRLWHGRGEYEMKIDFVPFGELESPPGQIAFPPDGDFVMKTLGFKEAYQNSVIVNLAEDLTMRVVSPAGLTILKFISYRDKPYLRIRDLQDIWFMMKNYLEIGNEDRLYEDADLVSEEDFDFRTVGARLLGRDIQPLLTEQTKTIILKMLAEDEAQGLPHLAEIVDRSENLPGDRLPEIMGMFQQLKKGINEQL